MTEVLVRAVEVFAVIHLMITGLSHIFRPAAWVDFFVWLRSRGEVGVFVHGFLSLGFGSTIVAFHNIWSGLPAVLTVVGYLYIFKAFLCFVFPGTQLRTLARVRHERTRELVGAGIAYVAISALLSYSLWLT